MYTFMWILVISSILKIFEYLFFVYKGKNKIVTHGVMAVCIPIEIAWLFWTIFLLMKLN